MTMEEILTSGLAELGVPTTAAQLSQLRAYYTLLDERSKVMNLTAIEGEEATARLHFLDSAALLRYVRLSGKAAADIGSGAGFPGLVAAILAPDADITLIDSLQKRVTFQQEVCDTVGLGNVTCLAGRAEEESALRESFEVVTSRAGAQPAWDFTFTEPVCTGQGSGPPLLRRYSAWWKRCRRRRAASARSAAGNRASRNTPFPARTPCTASLSSRKPRPPRRNIPAGSP